MSLLDWLVLGGSLVFIVVYGVWKGRRQTDMKSYLLNRGASWPVVALSIMATQASAITFLSTPGQAYADGMRFVQFYFGLPIAMVVLSLTAVPVYHRLKVYTAYEYLEGRFDLKTRSATAILFLLQRGLATGLTIYAPALVLSVLLGWSIGTTTLVMGGLVVVYVASGGTKAVSATQVQQLVIILFGMVSAAVVLVRLLPPGIRVVDALGAAGRLGRLNAVDFSFDLSNRYNLWSGLVGGFFLALSYFGTDQSQVQRYLTGSSVAQSRTALLFNGLFKVPMQFSILLLGALVFGLYLFVRPPVFFNPVETDRAAAGPHAAEMKVVDAEHGAAFEARKRAAEAFVTARRGGDPAAIEKAGAALEAAQARFTEVRTRAVAVIKRTDPSNDGRDANYVFLRFVLGNLPAGLVGLVLAATFAASMSSTAAELNALSTTAVVDIYLRLVRRDARDAHYVQVSKGITVFWGLFAIAFAQYASRLGTLIEAVNILGSLFYGTILGIFVVAFTLPRVGGTAVFWGALAGEVAVLACFFLTGISFLWYNVVGCLVTAGAALALSPVVGWREVPGEA